MKDLFQLRCQDLYYDLGRTFGCYEILRGHGVRHSIKYSFSVNSFFHGYKSS